MAKIDENERDPRPVGTPLNWLERDLAEKDDHSLRTMAPENNLSAWRRWLKERPRQPGHSIRENSEYVARQMHDLVASGVPLDYETLEELKNTREMNAEVNFGRVGETFKQDPRVHRWLIGQGREDKVLNWESHTHLSPQPTEEEQKYAFQSLKDRVEESVKKDPASILTGDDDGLRVEGLLRHRDPQIAEWSRSTLAHAQDTVADKVVKDTLNYQPHPAFRGDPLKLALNGVWAKQQGKFEVLRHVKEGLARHPQIFDVLGGRKNPDDPALEQELLGKALDGSRGVGDNPGRTPTPQQTAKILDNNYHLWNEIHSRPNLAFPAVPYVKDPQITVKRIISMNNAGARRIRGLSDSDEGISREHVLQYGPGHQHLVDLGLKEGKINTDDLMNMIRGTPEARNTALRASVWRRLHPGQPPVSVSPLETSHLREALPYVLSDVKSMDQEGGGEGGGDPLPWGRPAGPGHQNHPLSAFVKHKALSADLADKVFEATRGWRFQNGLNQDLAEHPSLGEGTISKMLADSTTGLAVRRSLIAHPNSTSLHEKEAMRSPLLYAAVAMKQGADPDNLRELYRRYEANEGDINHATISPLWANDSTPSDVIDRHVRAFHRDYEALKNVEGRFGELPSHQESLLNNKYRNAIRLISDHQNASVEALGLIDRSHGTPALLTPEHRENLKERLALESPDLAQGPKGKKVGVRVGSARYRRARDHIAATGKPQLPPKAMIVGDWGVARAPNGDISADRLDQHIASLPEMKFNVTYGRWGTKLEGKRSEHPLVDMRRHRLSEQRHSAGISRVFQLNLTDDHVRQMKDAGVFDTFKKVYEASKYSNHPVGKAGIGWVRWTGNRVGSRMDESLALRQRRQHQIFVDEVQSDLGGFGRSLTADARKKAQEDARDKQLPPDQAKAYEDEFVKRAQGEFDAQYPPDHLSKINQIVFGSHKPNEVILESFHQHLRDKGLPHATVHIHSVDSKKKQMLDANYFEDGAVPAHFQHTYEQLPKKMGMQPAKYGELQTESNPDMKGLPVWEGPVRKTEDEFAVLGKSEREKCLTEVSSVAVFDPRGQLLLGRRSDSKKWTLPGGHAEPDEDPDDCARRELKEEAAIDLPYDRFTFLGTGRVNGVVVCSYAVYLKPAEVRQAPHGRDDPDEECSEWKFFSAKDGLPQEVRDELHAKRNVTLALAGLGSPEGIDFGEGLAVASESNRVLVVPKGGGSAPKRGNDLKKSGGSKLYHGSRTGLTGSTLRAGACLTSSPDTARHYAGDGGRVYEVGLKLPPVASERQVRQALTDEGVEVGEHLFETVDDHVPLLGEHYDACEYQDMDPNGVTHRCIRLLTDVEPHLLQEVGDLNKSEVDELLQHPDPLERSIALRSVGVGPHHLIRALHDPDPGVRATAAHHPGVDAHVLLGFMAAPSFTRQEQLQLLRDHPAVNQDHVRALVGFVARDPNGEPPETVRTLAQNPLLDEDSVRVLWDLGDQGTRMLLVGHPACPPDLREGVVQDELRQPLGASTAALAIEALAHPLAAQLRAGVLRSGRMELVSALAGAPDLQPELIDEVLGYGRVPTEPDTWADARVKVLSGTNVTKQHLDTALEDRHPAVRAAVFSSPSPDLSRAHVLRAIARGEPELMKMALADVSLGSEIPRGDLRLKHNFDYSHVLPDSARKAGYSIRVSHPTHQFGKVTPTFVETLALFNGEPVGELRSYVSSGGRSFKPEETLLDEKHRGRGVGFAMYEAALAHAHNHLGCSEVSGGNHSTDAARVHQKLAIKHGLDYEAAKQKPIDHPKGWDNAWGPYAYSMKPVPKPVEVDDDDDEDLL